MVGFLVREAVVLLLVCSVVWAGEPHIDCSAPIYDFGRCDNQAAVQHVFELMNGGTAELDISRVRGGCCGSTTSLGKRALAPGESTELKVTFGLSGRKGSQQKRFYVLSNDPSQPCLALSLVGAATVPVDIDPQVADFGRVQTNAVLRKSIAIRCQPEYGFVITNVVIPDNLNVTALFESSDPLKHRVSLTVNPPYKPGLNRATVGLLTDSEVLRFKRVDIPVSLLTASDVMAVPHQIRLLAEKKPRPLTRYVALRSVSGKPFRVTEVELPDSWIDVKVEPLGKTGYRCVFSNIFAFPALDGSEIRITTDMDNPKTIAIPIKVLEP